MNNCIILSNGFQIPNIGIGTWQITDKEQISEIIKNARELGYRLIDTAAAYSNEISISKAISKLDLNRQDIIISDKVWNTSRGYQAVQDACKKSLKKLKTDYIDIYLVHWPASMKLYSDWADINADTWRGMEQLYKDGFVRAIGVCNFKIHHLQELKKTADIMPMINQIEYHPGLDKKDILHYCNENDIKVEASSPLGNGEILNNNILKEIAEKKRKTVAQISIRWEIQKGLIVIPKICNIGRLAENMDVFDFELSKEEMSEIDNIPYCGGIGIDSDEVIEFG